MRYEERSKTPPSLLIDTDELRRLSAELQDRFHPGKNKGATAQETALVYNICTGIMGACDEIERARGEMAKVDELKGEVARLLSIVTGSAEALSLVVLKQNARRSERGGMFEEAFSSLLKHAVAVKFQRTDPQNEEERPTPAESFEDQERNPFIEGVAPVEAS